MKLCVAGLLAMLALLPAWSTTANVPNTVASGEVPTSAGAVTVPLNQAAIDKLNYCRERGLTFWLGVRSSDEETKLLWFYDPIHFVVNGTELSPLPTTYVGFPHPGVDKHRIGTSWGYEPNHWNFLCSGHAGDSGGGWEPGMVTRGMEQYQVTVGQPVTTAVVQVPASVAAYSSPGVTYHFVVFAEDFTFAWQEYPYNSNYPQATGTPIHNDSAKAYRIWNGMSTEYAPGAPPWYAPPSVTPTNGDPVNLVTGEEDHAAAPDISVRDSVGQPITFARSYATTNAKAGRCSPGLSAGWTHAYDYYIEGPSTPGTWGDLTLRPPSGGKETLTPEIAGSTFQPTGKFHSADGVPHIVSGVPGTTPGTWQSISMVHRTGVVWTFLPSSGTSYYVLGSISDALGNAVTFTWGSGRRLTAVRTADGQSTLLAMTYDGAGLLAAVSDTTGRKVVYSFAPAAAPFSTLRLETVSQIAPTAQGNPPMRWRYTYDASAGMPLIRTLNQPSPTGTGESTLSFEYAAGKVTAQIDANGNRTEYAYNANHTTTVTVRNAQGAVLETHTQHFDVLGRDTGITDALGQRSTLAYEDPANAFTATAITGSDGRSVCMTYDTRGNLRTMTDARGITTECIYDYSRTEFGRVKQVKRNGILMSEVTNRLEPSGLVKSTMRLRPGSVLGKLEYDTSTVTYDFEENAALTYGRVVAASTPGDAKTPVRISGFVYNYTDDAQYDADGNPGVMHLAEPSCSPITLTDGAGRTTHLRYDDRGNLRLVTDSSGSRTDYAYNIADQVTEVILPEIKAGAGRDRVVTDYLFPGGLAWRTRLLAADGVTVKRCTTISYDCEGQVRARTGTKEDAQFEYDALYRLTRLTDADGHSTVYNYDAVGRQYRIAYPGGRTWEVVEFDGAGRVKTAEERGGGATRRTEYSYDDPGGLLTDVDYADTAAAVDVHYSYDPLGQVVNIADATGSRSFTYDLQGNVLTATTQYAGLVDTLPGGMTLRYEYNQDGTRSSLTTPFGVFGATYDAVGRPETLVNPSGRRAKWSYDPLDRVDRVTLGNRAWTSFRYDVLGRATAQTSYSPTGRLLAEYASVERDDLGRLTGYDCRLPGLPGMSGSQRFSYDHLDRLSGAVFETPTLPRALETFSYDVAGNITDFPHQMADFAGLPRAHDAANRWVGFRNAQGQLVGGDLFAYDGFGNPTTYKGDSLAFDRNNHLTAYRKRTMLNGQPSLTLAMEAGYRSDGLRAWKESGGHRTYFLYDGVAVLAELSTTGTVTSYNTWGPTGLLARTTLQTNAERWYLFDPTGSVALRLDGAGMTVSGDRYDSYGVCRAGGEAGDPVGFKGQAGYYTDWETGLVLCTWRFYDPLAGRWLTEDPIGYDGGLNVYGYCGANPVLNTDALGLAAGFDDVGAIVAGVAINVGGQLVADLAQWKLSCGQKYIGKVIGGAVGGWVGLYASPWVGGAVASGLSSLIEQVLLVLTDPDTRASGRTAIWDIDWVKVLKEAGVGAICGKVFGALKLPLKWTGVNAGRNSFMAIRAQLMTKLERGLISNVSLKSAAKWAFGKGFDDFLKNVASQSMETMWNMLEAVMKVGEAEVAQAQ